MKEPLFGKKKKICFQLLHALHFCMVSHLRCFVVGFFFFFFFFVFVLFSVFFFFFLMMCVFKIIKAEKENKNIRGKTIQNDFLTRTC